MDLQAVHIVASAAVVSWTSAALDTHARQQWKAEQAINRTVSNDDLDDIHSLALHLTHSAIEGVDRVLSGGHSADKERVREHLSRAQEIVTRLTQTAIEEAVRRITQLSEELMQSCIAVIDPMTKESAGDENEENYEVMPSEMKSSKRETTEYIGDESDANSKNEATTEFSADFVVHLIEDAIMNVMVEPYVLVTAAFVSTEETTVAAVSSSDEGGVDKILGEVSSEFTSNYTSSLLEDAIRNTKLQYPGSQTTAIASVIPQELESKDEESLQAANTVGLSMPHAQSDVNPVALAEIRSSKAAAKSHKARHVVHLLGFLRPMRRHGQVTIETGQPPRLRKLEEYMAMHPVDRAKKVYRSPKPKPLLPHHKSPRLCGYHADGDNADSDSPSTPTTRHVALAPLVMPLLPSPTKVHLPSTVVDRPDRLGLLNKPKKRSGYCQQCLHEGRSCKISDCLKHQLLR